MRKMIVGSPAWQNALLQQNMRPLYILEIADYALYLASFTSDANVILGGYGVVTYGVGTYGT